MNCPECQRPIYSRQHPRCGYCGAALPAEFLLAAHEVDEIKEEMREIEMRCQIAKDKEEEEQKREASRRRNQHFHSGGFTGMP